MSKSEKLPDFPWDTISGAKKKATAHPRGIVDLTVGTPVDPTPEIIQDTLRKASNAHGYPQVWGTPELRQQIISWLMDVANAVTLPEQGVLPVIGTKEAIAWLPTMLDIGQADTVVIPECAYPTYEVGAAMVGANIIACDDPEKLEAEISAGATAPKLIWLNSPANPHGGILSKAQLTRWVEFSRSHSAVLASDECYFPFAWDSPAVSILDQDVCGSDPTGLLVVQSTSKRSNMAGFRAGFFAGDPTLVMELLALRKHLGMMVPAPVLAAMQVAFSDETHVEEQKQRYLRRREILSEALVKAGFRIDDSQGSLYLWVTEDEPCRKTTDKFAEHGILVAPGDFYADETHVRVSLTATDERIQEAANRLESISS